MRLERVQNYYPLIVECYKSDEQRVLECWHRPDEKTAEACARLQEQDLLGVQGDFKLFKILNGKHLVGYFGPETYKQHNYLTTWFLCPEYRNTDGVTKFWGTIANYFSAPFYAGVYAANKYAIAFLQRQGGIESHHPNVGGYEGVVFRFEGK